MDALIMIRNYVHYTALIIVPLTVIQQSNNFIQSVYITGKGLIH